VSRWRWAFERRGTPCENQEEAVLVDGGAAASKDARKTSGAADDALQNGHKCPEELILGPLKGSGLHR
jgi:hypothetical protein